ncbi:cytochrome P450 [Streptomyces anulatus]|uniref:cytochrome P450 family protein n=1 Tax=Streptomyces anulatus TaxID=1892 RepID=UPI002E8066C5|nr:cytochrome P450 [Streptomyces anulatus]WUC91864.1 cytochrome P450 [Streptomyces anulatus]
MSERHFFDRTYRDDPIAILGQWRDEAAVTHVVTPAGTPTALVTRYADVRTLLMDKSLSMNGEQDRARIQGQSPQELPKDLVDSDPPDHTRLRRIVAGAFTPASLQAFKPRIKEIVRDTLAPLHPGGQADLVSQVATPLPIAVIADFLGFPRPSAAEVKRLSDVLFLDGVPPAEVSSSIAQITQIVSREIAAKRRQTGNDLLSDLIEAREHRQTLSEAELLSMTTLMLIAAFQNVTHALSSGMQQLLSNPEQLALLRARPDLAPQAIQEILRHASPGLFSTRRFPTTPVTVQETVIAPGESLLLSLASANHDPLAFTEPDRFDITRNEAQHLSYGHGIHYCLGAALANIELEIAIVELISRFPRLRLADDGHDLVWLNSYKSRGLQNLNVCL